MLPFCFTENGMHSQQGNPKNRELRHTVKSVMLKKGDVSLGELNTETKSQNRRVTF